MQLPDHWTYAKIDLFDNATTEELAQGKRKFKAALNFKTRDSDEWHRYWISLNSPKRFVWRRVKELRTTPHYQLVKKIMQCMETDYRVSKFYDSEGDTVFNLTGLLVPEQDNYSFVLVYKEQFMTFELNCQQLTALQRSKNMIASGELKRQAVADKPRKFIP